MLDGHHGSVQLRRRQQEPVAGDRLEAQLDAGSPRELSGQSSHDRARDPAPAAVPPSSAIETRLRQAWQIPMSSPMSSFAASALARAGGSGRVDTLRAKQETSDDSVPSPLRRPVRTRSGRS